MANITTILKKEFEKTGGAKVTKVPTDKMPTLESLEDLENEISDQINRNDAMRQRTINNSK